MGCLSLLGPRYVLPAGPPLSTQRRGATCCTLHLPHSTTWYVRRSVAPWTWPVRIRCGYSISCWHSGFLRAVGLVCSWFLIFQTTLGGSLLRRSRSCLPRTESTVAAQRQSFFLHWPATGVSVSCVEVCDELWTMLSGDEVRAALTFLIVATGDEARDGSVGNAYETEIAVTASGLLGAIVPWLMCCQLVITPCFSSPCSALRSTTVFRTSARSSCVLDSTICCCFAGGSWVKLALSLFEQLH